MDFDRLKAVFSRLTVAQIVTISKAEGITICSKDWRQRQNLLIKWQGQVLSAIGNTIQRSGLQVPDDARVDLIKLQNLFANLSSATIMELITTKSKREHMWRVGPTPKRACYNMWQALDAPLTAEGKMTALIEGPFLALVLESVLEKCTCTFRVAMGNNTTAKAICGACARTTPKCHIESLSLDQIPHHEGLSVLYPHPDQYTTTGMVLYEKAVTDGHTEICHDCMAKLKQRWRPVMSLSNNMWIGDIPSELSSLTLPDQSLPPHPRVLAAMIGITFVGLHNAPKQVLRGLFRALPVDDVPTELHQIAKLLTDGTVLEDEHGSYVPNETDSQNEGNSLKAETTLDQEFLMDIDYEDPSIIPVQSHGMINTDTAGIPDLQLLSSALANTGREMAEYEELLVKHSSAPALGSHQIISLFCLDLQFIFQVFSMILKWRVYSSSLIQIKSEFVRASLEEEKRLPFSNPTIQLFQKHLTGLRAKVMGTDESWYSIRSQIWGCTLANGPPSLWLMINPSDINDPIAQALAGEDINLDDFVAEHGPDATTHSINITSDPFTASEFFHLTIKAMLEHLFSLSSDKRSSKARLKRKPGIVGTVKAYISTVEVQGRGMLHLHLLIWLEGASTAQEMTTALFTEEFCQKAHTWIGQNISTDIGGLSTDTIDKLPYKNACFFSRPPDIDTDDYETKQKARLTMLARTLQVHVCKGHSCLRFYKGAEICKQGAPFQCLVLPWVTENGDWGPACIHKFVVAFNPMLMLNLCCNHDVKILTNTSNMGGIAWYITLYATKKQQKLSNTSAVLAQQLAFQSLEVCKYGTVDDLNRKMINRCANTLGRDQEFSAPEVIRFQESMGECDRAAESAKLGEDNQTTMQPSGGHLELRDQKDKYIFQPAELKHFNYWDYFIETYNQSDPDGEELYCASMLALFKPWQQLGVLKDTNQMFKNAFDMFMLNCPQEFKHVINNIKYHYTISEAAHRDLPHMDQGPTADLVDAREDVSSEPDIHFVDHNLDKNITDNRIRNYMWGDSSFTENVDNSVEEEAAGMATGVLEVNEEPPALDMMNWEGQIIDQTKDDSTDNITFNSEQQRALNIIKHHIVQEISLWSPEQLLMVMNGCGGTGKSVLIEVITQSMVQLRVSHWLAKTTTSGVAVTHIGGMTLHSWAVVWVNPKVCCQTKCHAGNCSMGAFGGVNVILFRDLHQFPPVVKTGALYYSDMPSVGLSLGQRLFEAFTTVVTLTQQMRVRDPLWTVLLGRLRVGGCTKDAIVMVKLLVLTNGSYTKPDFTVKP
ncbi:hypothetical protein BDN71DRAFT_1435175 [Pleurotus eryngii]|uniref:ATP-dependent DNA helicase n=1 Tax=Pleurotus eryngii TaxID=5323 RepID=A0A9P6DBR1_PLEER|nr:hypothetical protein BDN71DRAFT_1435175 [Pleurotus eryngii]